jgi:nicotinamidase-related amidase
MIDIMRVLILILFLVLTGCDDGGNGSWAVAQNTPITVVLRNYNPAGDPDVFDTEMDSTYRYETREYDPGYVALLLIDVWEHHSNDGFHLRMTDNRIHCVEPLVEKLRNKGALIVHACYNEHLHGCALQVEQGDMVLESSCDSYCFYDKMTALGITTVFVAGYASNLCVLSRPVGIDFLIQRPFEKVIFVRDCSIAFEMPETLEGEYCHMAITNMLEVKEKVSTTTNEEID